MEEKKNENSIVNILHTTRQDVVLQGRVAQSLVRITLHSLCTASSQAFSVNASLIATTKNERTILRMNLASKKYFTA